MWKEIVNVQLVNKLALLLLLLVIPACVYGQARNERPMYGGIPPNKVEAEADQKLIDWTIEKFGSREKGAENAIRLGFKYLANGDWSTAMKRFNQAWLLNGETAETNWGWGAALSYQGAFSESEKYFVKARELDGKNAPPIDRLRFSVSVLGHQRRRGQTTEGRVPGQVNRAL